jgi:long-subunit acyl-CoA synthetase (AMP-forming)
MPNIYDEAKQELIEIETYLEHSLDHIAKALERAKKVEELLDLYRLQQEFKERYNTQVRLLDRQETLDDIREIAEEIYRKEKELEALK